MLYLELLPEELIELIYFYIHKDKYNIVMAELIYKQSIPYIAEVFVQNIIEDVLANLE